MNLNEISQPSDLALLESFQDDSSSYPASLLLEIYRSYTTEVKKAGMKPKMTSRSDGPAAPVISARGVIRVLKMATKSIATQTLVPAVRADYDEFIKFKKLNPAVPYPGGDKDFKSGAKFANAVPGIREAKLTSDMHVVYVTRPDKDENNLPIINVYIFGIYSHGDLGIGNNTQPRVNDQMSTRFKNALANPD